MLQRSPPWLLTALLAALYLLLDPPSADLAAQEYRADVFDRAGFVLWDNAWYGGHHMPGYSVLFPPLAGWTDPRLVGACAVVAAAWLFDRIVVEHFGPHARLGAWWFAAGTVGMLISGRLTFALGCALGLAAVLAALRGRGALAALAALLASLGSPVAGLFLALGAGAWWLADAARRRAATVLGAAALAPVAALALLFSEGGAEPFVSSAFWPSLIALGVVFAVLPRTERVLRAALVLYALATIASFALDTPMGGNVTRLGAVFAGPLLACLLYPRHARALAVLAVGFVYWQAYPPVRDWTRASGDPSVHERYYEPLLAYLEQRRAVEGPLRVEVAFTENHWDARWVGARLPMARGWERQLDVGRNELFYTGTLTADRYTRWLADNAIRYIAVPDVDLDASATDEARLLARGVPGVSPAWHDAHWRVYRVQAAVPLVAGAVLTALGVDSFGLRLPARGGEALVRIRWSRWWKVEHGDATLRRAAGDWTLVRGRGVVSIAARL